MNTVRFSGISGVFLDKLCKCLQDNTTSVPEWLSINILCDDHDPSPCFIRPSHPWRKTPWFYKSKKPFITEMGSESFDMLHTKPFSCMRSSYPIDQQLSRRSSSENALKKRKLPR